MSEKTEKKECFANGCTYNQDGKYCCIFEVDESVEGITSEPLHIDVMGVCSHYEPNPNLINLDVVVECPDEQEELALEIITDVLEFLDDKYVLSSHTPYCKGGSRFGLEGKKKDVN